MHIYILIYTHIMDMHMYICISFYIIQSLIAYFVVCVHAICRQKYAHTLFDLPQEASWRTGH